MEFTLVYSWKLKTLWGETGSPFYGRACKIIARGAMNSRMIQFENGELAIVSGNSLRRRKAA